MANFPHLQLAYVGKLRAIFRPDRRQNAEVTAIKGRRGQHAATLRGLLEGLEGNYEVMSVARFESGLPPVPANAGFLLRLPEGANADGIAHALGVELVAEADGGFILVASEDLTFARIREVLAQFEADQRGGGAAASMLEVFTGPDDPRRLSRILSPDVLSLWPWADDQVFTFDLSFQTAPSLRTVAFPRLKKRGTETPEEFAVRKRAGRDAILVQASDRWAEAAEQRFHQLMTLVNYYEGTLLIGMANDPERVAARGIVFADCFQVRVRMSGRGFKDVVLNSPHLFEVAQPEEAQLPDSVAAPGATAQVQVSAPMAGAPTVCVIDSGIEEGHLWLAPAIDTASSRCFLPGVTREAVQDETSGAGHGTRVAGAVLYPATVPPAGAVQPIAWIQNARVLNAAGKIPTELSPPRYLQDVVEHCAASERATKIFNHSIGGEVPCPVSRMTAWAAKMDELSALRDVLFIQAAGNLWTSGANAANPGIYEHLQANRNYPDYLLEGSSRVSNPAQSLQALTVGAVSGAILTVANQKSFTDEPGQPSPFSRAGFGMWQAVKPEVVEIGGDLLRNTAGLAMPAPHTDLSVELLCATHNGAAAYAKDGVGTSFAAPKVAHVAAQLQVLFPTASPLLYRALIVQSARWPAWAEAAPDKDRVLRLIGFGRPDSLRATDNATTRITLITPDAVEIRNKDLHLYAVRIPAGLRNLGADSQVRMEVTLSYASEPRRTRRSRNGYLRTWLDWRSSGLNEPFEAFKQRMTGPSATRRRTYTQPAWTLHYVDQHGEAEDTHRGRGTVQKDWALVNAHDLPEILGIAVRAHAGWDHRPEEGLARYCLVVSFEAVGAELPIYTLVAEAQVPVQAEVPVEVTVLPR